LNKKSFIALGLVTLYAGNFVLIYLLYIVAQQQFKAEMMRDIQAGTYKSIAVETLNVSPNDIEYIEEHEFQYKGEMYDAISINKTPNGQLCISCIKDANENKLLTDYANKEGQAKKIKSFNLLESVAIITIAQLPKNHFNLVQTTIWYGKPDQDEVQFEINKPPKYLV